MSRTAALADHLDERIDSIISAWKAETLREGDVPDARRLSHDELVDHVPDILDRIADRLRGDRDVDATAEGRKHGEVRWRQGYDIAEVISEFGHLRTALLRATFAHARDGDFDLDTLERASIAINDVLDEAGAESVRQFQIDSQLQTRAMLVEVERRKGAVDTERGKLQTVLNNLPVGVWVINAEGLLVGANREAERLQGFPARTPVNFHNHAAHYRLFGPDGHPLGSHEFPALRALRGDEVFQEDILWETHGKTRRITVNAAPLIDADGTIAGAIVVGQDVTERQTLRDSLADSEARLRAIAEQSPAMIWRADPSGRCDYFNRTWLEFRGRPLEEEVGNGWAQGIHPDDVDACRAVYQGAVGRREVFETTYRLLRHDGEYRSIVDRGTPYFDAQGELLGYLGSCMDITDRVAIEAKLAQQSEHKSRLMAALSHDARTPLNAVFLAAQLLETQVKDGADPEVQESLQVIRNSVKNVLDLLSDLLDLTRIDAGATRAEVSRFALGQTLIECLSPIELQAKAKGLDVRFDPDGLTGLNLATDRNKLKQILANFLSNALRYTDRGGITLRGDRTGGRLLIAVQDTGIGIAPEDQARVFDEFAMLGKDRHDSSEGTGLGLAICRRLAGLLQGEILLESEPGRGTTFTLALPDHLIVEGEIETVEPVVAVSPDSGPILVAEDHEPSRRALARIMRRFGYRVLEAGNGQEVLDEARRERPFIILMDINMPGINGIDATLALRADPLTRDVPIFALTGDVTALNQQRIGEAGVDGYLEKPVTWEQIERASTLR